MTKGLFGVIRDFSLCIIFSESTADSVLFSGLLPAELFLREMLSVLCSTSPLMRGGRTWLNNYWFVHLRQVSFLSILHSKTFKSLFT